MENTLYRAANRFQNLIIKSLSLKVIYFIFMQVLTVRYISLLFLIPCQLFSGIQKGKQIIEKLMIIIKENQSGSTVLFLLIIIGVVVILYAAIFSQSEIASKSAFISLLFIQQSSPFLGIVNLAILTENQINIFLKILAVLILLIIESLTFVADKVLITYSFETGNLFAHKYNSIMAYGRLAEKVFFYVTFTMGLVISISPQFIKLYYMSILLIQLVKIKEMIKEKYYIEETTNYLEMFASIISATILLEATAFEFYSISNMKTNIFVLWPIVSVFASTSVYVYCSQRTNEYFFKNVEEVCEKNQTISYLQAFYILWKNSVWKNSESDYYSLIVASIRKNHQYLCRKPKCYCYQANQIEKQKKNVSDGNSIFFKGYYQEILNFIDKQNKSHDQKFLKILYFKFKIFNNCIKLSRELHKIKSSIYDVSEMAIGRNILQNYIESVYEKHTNNNKQDCLRVELPMELNHTLVKLEKIVFNDIYVKNKKWNTLGKNFCKILDIEGEIEKQIHNLREYDEIYENYKVAYKKSLAFNALSMFYYADIAFINKKVEIIQSNMRQLRNPIKYREVISNKELAKHILDNRCCLLEIDLSASESVKVTELSISNSTQNVKEIFKFDKEHFRGRSIESLFPKILLETEKKFFEKFLNPNEEAGMNEAADKFFVDKSGHVFEALINLKVIAQNNKIILMIVVFQKETKNILLLNEKGIIENIGETFVTYFGKIYEGIPFQSFFYFDDEYESINFTEKFMRNKYTFINSVELGEDWISYLESVKAFLKKKKAMSSTKLKDINQSEQSVESKKKLVWERDDQQISDFLRKEKTQLIKKKVSNNNEMSNNTQSGKAITPSSTGISILSVSLDYKVIPYENCSVKVVVIEEIKRKKSANDQTQQTIKSFHEKIKKKQGRNYEGTLKKIENNPDDNQVLSEVDNQDDNQDDVMPSVDLEEEMKKKKKNEKQEILHQASSVQSSMRGSTVSYFYMKFIDTCFALFRHPNAIVDQRLNKFTFGSLIVTFCMSGLIVGTYIFFNLGLYEVKDIFFADGAVSDNMQLTEFLYNRGMNFKQFKDEPNELESIKRAAFYERDYVYGLQAYDLACLLSEETSMTKTKFYEYIKVPVIWRFLDPMTPALELDSNQFLIYFYRLSQSVQQSILDPTPEGRQTVQNALQLMRVNFPEMKRVNHYNLYLYQQMSDDSIALLRQLIFILTATHVGLSLILYVMYYREKIFRKNQLIESYSIYKMIPPKVIQFVANYYGFYCQEIHNEKELFRYETHYERRPLYLPLDLNNTMKANKSLFSEKKVFVTKSVIKMLFIIFILNLTFGLMLLTIKNLFNPIELMMRNVNNLMDSENYLIEAYDDLKAKFIIEENITTLEEEFFEDLLETQRSVEVLFNKISVESLELFSNYDPDYKADFIDLLIKNICDLVEGQVEPQQMENCRNKLRLSYVSNGVITGMNFFTRRVREMIEQLKQKYFDSRNKIKNITKSEREFVLETLKSMDFRQIDESLIFMFKMFQSTQSRIFTSLQKAIISIMENSYTIVVLEVLFVGLLYPLFLLYNFRKEKFELSQLYVSFLLIPTPLARLLKTFSARLQQILEYDKTR